MQLLTRRFMQPLPPSNRRQPLPRNTGMLGNCIDVMASLPGESVDFVLTDPPYITRYRDRAGREVAGDDTADWLRPAFAEVYRLLKPRSFCVSFYGWGRADLFLTAWRSVGFRPVGHLIFRKCYASKVGYVKSEHEAAYLLAKGTPPAPLQPISDVLDWRYTGNLLHPTQKPIEVLTPLVQTFCPPRGLVLDPFCGSGSTLVAACETGRDWLGIEFDVTHCRTARSRLASMTVRCVDTSTIRR